MIPGSDVSVAAFARLAPGVTREQAEAELDAIAVRAEAMRPVANRSVRFAMTPVRESIVGNEARTSVALMGGGGVVAAALVGERRQPAARARHSSGEGDRGASCARRGALAPDPANADRQHRVCRRSAPSWASRSRLRSAHWSSTSCRGHCAINLASLTTPSTGARRCSLPRSPARSASSPGWCRRSNWRARM